MEKLLFAQVRMFYLAEEIVLFKLGVGLRVLRRGYHSSGNARGLHHPQTPLRRIVRCPSINVSVKLFTVSHTSLDGAESGFFRPDRIPRHPTKAFPFFIRLDSDRSEEHRV